MRRVSFGELGRRLREILEEVEAGVEVEVRRGRETVAHILPARRLFPASNGGVARSGPALEEALDRAVRECWEAYVTARREKGLRPPGRLPPAIAGLIRGSILRNDGAELVLDPERFQDESVALAAGEGLPLDTFMNGSSDRSTRPYLEPWRPWKLKKDGTDPAPGYADLAFSRRAERAELERRQRITEERRRLHAESHPEDHH